MAERVHGKGAVTIKGVFGMIIRELKQGREHHKARILSVKKGKKNRAARGARILVHFFDILYKTTT